MFNYLKPYTKFPDNHTQTQHEQTHLVANAWNVA